MRITAMATFPVNVAYRHAEISSRVRRGGVTGVIVRLETDNGLVGWGEACVGADAASIEAALARDAAVRASGATRGTARPSPATSTARGCGTIASRPATSPSPASTWRSGTCAARRAASRCTACSAARCRDEIDYFYYLAQGTPDELRAQCAEGVGRGYRCYYLKVGIDAAAEEAMLEAVRAAIGPDGADPDRRQRGLVGARSGRGC